MHQALPRADLRQSNDYLVSKPYAWFVFSLTFLVMIFDYIDRQIIVSMFPYIKAEWSLSDAQLGALASITALAVGLGAIPVALLADRWSRVKSIVVMVTVWSLATLSCGFSRSHAQLFTARFFVGAGEAGYGSAGGALLAGLFPVHMRATILGAFLAAGLFGSVLGVILGGVIAARWGWRAGFGVVAIPGLLVGLLFLLVRDYKTVNMVDPEAALDQAGAKMGIKVMLASLFKKRSGVCAYLGGGLQLLVVSTVYSWLPSFLNRAYGLPGDKAGIKAAIVVLLGAIGAVFWAWAADRVSMNKLCNKMLLPAACSFASLLILTSAFALFPSGSTQFFLIAIGGFVMTGTVGSVAAIVMDVAHPGLRATAAGVLTLAQNVLGLAAGPFIAGALSDAYGLQTALAIMPSFCFGATVFLVYGSRFYEEEKKSADLIHIELENGSAKVFSANAKAPA